MKTSEYRLTTPKGRTLTARFMHVNTHTVWFVVAGRGDQPVLMDREHALREKRIMRKRGWRCISMS